MVRLSGLKQKSLLFTLVLVIWSFLFSTIAEAQPYPPINLNVTSRANDNRLGWGHHPQNTAGTVTSYRIYRRTPSGPTVQIATPTAATVNFNDSTAGYSPDQEFFYTICSFGPGGLSVPSEQVMRFLPTVGLTNTNMTTHTLQNIHYGSWEPYPGEWTDTIAYLRSTPDGGGTNWGGADYVQRQIIRATLSGTQIQNVPVVGGPYYFNVAIYAPDWRDNPAKRRLVSYSASRPYYINPEVPYEDNASATFFNNSQKRVMAEPLITGGVGTKMFSSNGNNFWRIRRPIGVTSHVSRVDTVPLNQTPPSIGTIVPAKINSPCRVVVSGISADEIAPTRSDDEVRVADQYGNELPCVVFNETVAAGSVTGFDVHFIASQDGNAQEIYWIYWGNSSATAPVYSNPGFSDNLSKTSQFAYSPWYSRRIHRGGIETVNNVNRLASDSGPINDQSVSLTLPFPTAFRYFDFATTTVNVSTSGFISFPPASYTFNTWADFIGPSPNRFIAPFWCNLAQNSNPPSDSGLYYHNLDGGTATRHRAMLTWRANRFNAPDETYIFQAALYREGDIALRYQFLNYLALTEPSIIDNPINIFPHHTVGLSATDGNRWLTITDGTENPEVASLRRDEKNVIHYFQSCHGWATATVTDFTNSCAMAGLTCVGDYESRIFDGRSSSPTWSNIVYEVTGGGSIVLYVRSSGTTTFTPWAPAHRVVPDLVAGTGVITLPPPNLTDRYVQYKLVFKKQDPGDDPVLRSIKFGVGYIMIDNTTNQANGVDVSQGQTFLASMTYTNAFSGGKLDTLIASLTFSPASSLQTWTRTTPLPLEVDTDESRTIGFQVTVATNSGSLDAFTTINGYVAAGSGSTTLTSSSAITISNYRVRKAAEMKIDFVDTPFEKVNKGQGGLPVQIQVSNGSPYVPLIIDGASLSFSLGQYSITPEYGIDPLASGVYAAYFNTSNTNPPPFPAQQVATRIDNQVNFNWVTASPILGVVTTDYFAVRWSGYVIPEFNENYTFYVNADDGTSLWVNGQLIINSWVSSASKRTSVTIPLNAGVPATILLETFERTGNARAELSWSSPSLAEEIIPSARLKPAYVLRGGQTMLLNFKVGIIDTSPSGVAYISATASGTNGWVPGLVTDSSNPAVIDSWIIQSPASLAIGLIKAPPIVYRGQANVPVEVEIINIGEADAQIASIPLFLSLGDYTDIIPGETMPVTITGGTSKFIKVLVSIQESTATGTADIDAEVSGIDANDGGDLDASGAALPAQWTILAEKILTYKDPSHLYPRTAFARPDSSTTDVHALAENLAPLKEYAIRFYDASGSEIISATTIAFSDPEGLLAAEYEIDSATPYGVYTIKITNPVNTYSPSQTSFRVVTTASVSASIVLPEKVSIGQNFAGVMTVNNSGGADALGMVPDPLTLTGPGTANILTGPNPAAPDITSNSLATITYTFLATGQGNYTVSAGASGFDASNDEPISAAYIDSNTCLIQTPALVSIAALTATPTFVSRYQRDIEVMVDLQNTGEADARITLADLRSPPNNTLAFGSALIASPTVLPAIIPGGSTATFTFRLTIAAAAPLGLASLTTRIQYTDVNNPGPVTQVINKILVFTVTNPNLLCYLNGTFTTESYRYNAGTTVFAKASGLPTGTDVRVRFYESNTPYTPTGPGVGPMTPLNTGTTGIVSHPGCLIPVDTTSLNQWMVIVDDGDDAAVGPNIFARQFFYVYLPATYSISLNLGSSTCYAGDYVNAAVTVTNLATWPTNIRQSLRFFYHIYAPDSAGSFNRIAFNTGTYAFPSGSSYTYNITMQADLNSGLNGSCTLRMPGVGTYSFLIYDDNQNGAGFSYNSNLDSVNPITIFRKSMLLQTLPIPETQPGLRGEYYHVNPINFPPPMPTGVPVTEIVDANVNYNWAANSPIPGIINTDYFAVRWTGFVTPDFNETYTFTTRIDDGSRLWVNGNLIVNSWTVKGAATNVSGAIAMSAGVPVPIVFEFFSGTGNAWAELRWQSLSVANNPVPSTHLSHTPYPPVVWDFGIAEPGNTSTVVESRLTNTGNHDLERVRLSRVDLRKSITETISGANLLTVPATPFSLPINASMTLHSSIEIPLYQPAGVYVATMALFEDHNDSNSLELAAASREPHKLVMTKVEVKSVAKAILADNFIDLGVIEAGLTSDILPLEIVGVGNLALTDLKFDDMSVHGITITPLVIGAMTYNGVAYASISVTVPLAQPAAVYYATGTLRDDIPGGAFDEFTVKWAVGSQSFAVSPELFELGNATPTFLLPTYTSTITNTGELPLSRLKSFSTEFINIDQSGSVATDNINLTSPAFIDILNSEPSQAYVYVPGGKATGTYTATFTWYEDTNKNNVKDAQEGTDHSIASFVVQPFYKIYPWKITADFGGVKPNTTKTISIGIINAGSLPVSRLRFINSDLSDGTNTFAEGHLTLPANVLDITPGELRYFDISATVPPAHINSVFIGSMTVYGDLNDNSNLDSADEPWCDMKLRIEIGDQKLNITSPVEVILSGYAASSTNSVSIAAKNTGSMALSRVRMQSTDLVPGAGSPVASSTVLFSPSALLGSLVINQTRSPAVMGAVPFGQPPGLYEGTIWAWEDANNDSIRQIEETAASVPVKLTISTLKALNVSPAGIFLGIFARGDTATASLIAQNIGNTNLDDARWHKAPIGSIASAGITITPDPVGYVDTPAIGFPENVVSTLTLSIPTSGVPDGLHSGVQKFYEDENDPALNIYDPGLEPFANLTLSIRIATPFISVTPDPIVIPAADPVGQTASGNFIIQNSSILNYKNLRYRVGNLTSGANTIASSAITTLPGTFTALLAGQSEAAEISARVFPPHSYPPGVYTGAFTIYDDRNFNGVRDLHEQETTAVISLTIKTYPGLDILQTNLNAGKIARNTFSTALPIGFRNTGNIPLNGLFWSASDLFKEPGILVPVASLTFAFSQPEPVNPGVYATSTLIIGRISPDQELGAPYGPALQTLQAGGIFDTVMIECEIIPGGPQGLDKGSVWQEVATATFPVSPLSQNYILSSYVCPGTGSARLGFLQTDEVGIQTGFSGITIDANGNISEFGTTGGVSTTFVQQYKPGINISWFRLFMRFNYGHNPNLASKTYILLQNMAPEGLGHGAWFDGIQLEKAGIDQTKPTTWAEGIKLFSPSNILDLSGKNSYYQW